MGRAPEIFGEFGTTLMAHDLDGGDESASMPPSSARDVRRLLKHAFRAAGSEAEAGGTEAAAAANEIMFSALRRANDLSAVAFPNFDADGLFPDNLPIFDFSGSAVLATRALDVQLLRRTLSGIGEGDYARDKWHGIFFAAPDPRRAHWTTACLCATVLLKVMKHTESADGQHACLVLGGPRMRVLDETEQPIEGGAPLARATKFEVVVDTDREDPRLVWRERIVRRRHECDVGRARGCTACMCWSKRARWTICCKMACRR